MIIIVIITAIIIISISISIIIIQNWASSDTWINGGGNSLQRRPPHRARDPGTPAASAPSPCARKQGRPTNSRVNSRPGQQPLRQRRRPALGNRAARQTAGSTTARVNSRCVSAVALREQRIGLQKPFWGPIENRNAELKCCNPLASKSALEPEPKESTTHPPYDIT